jgi:hypothetical protein
MLGGVSENILARVPGHLLAQALKKLPAADIWHTDSAETTIDVPGIGAVRVTAKRTKAKGGKSAHYVWAAESAVAVKQ